MNRMTCIVCPIGCQVEVVVNQENERITVSGNRCKRGENYARMEYSNPMRVLTSTIAIQGAIHRRLPVMTSGAIPKGRMNDVMKRIQGVEVSVPVHQREIIIPNVYGLGVDVIASRTMK